MLHAEPRRTLMTNLNMHPSWGTTSTMSVPLWTPLSRSRLSVHRSLCNTGQTRSRLGVIRRRERQGGLHEECACRGNDDQLYQLTVTYDRERIEGLTNEDVIESISAIYGTPLLRHSRSPHAASSADPLADTLIVAQWDDAASLLTLTRSKYSQEFQLILESRTSARSSHESGATTEPMSSPVKGQHRRGDREHHDGQRRNDAEPDDSRPNDEVPANRRDDRGPVRRDNDEEQERRDRRGS
jgi:hypothetical protein